MSQGTKFDSNKPRVSLIPTPALYETAKAFTYGANKYGVHNFKKGLEWSRLIDAALRHVYAFKDGEDLDTESGCNHLGNAIANLAMLLDQFESRKDLDDRYKPPVTLTKLEIENVVVNPTITVLDGKIV
jgi:hypothetical protein